MTVRDIVDMHEIEPGVDETRNMAGRRLDNDPPGWRRLLVAGSNRRRRMHDNGWQIITGDHRFNDLLRGNLALLISPYRAGFDLPHRLVGLSAICGALDGCHTARIDNARHSRGQRRLHKKSGPLPVVPQNFLRVADPEAV